jgi:Tfp pilus assembly protein PilV
MLARLRRRLADQRGYTIVEVMLTCVLTLIVTGTSLAVLDRAYRHNAEVQQRTESLQNARTTVDELVRRLRSQVCLNSTTPPVVAANGQSVTYYSDYTDAEPTDYPERHVIALNTATGALTDARYTTTTGAANAYTLRDTRLIARNVSQAGTTPLLQFYAYDSSTPPVATRALNTATVGVATDELPNVARIVVTLSAKAAGKTAAKTASTAQDEVFVRLTNPNSSDPSPRCTA